MMNVNVRAVADEAVAFLNKAVSPFHGCPL